VPGLAVLNFDFVIPFAVEFRFQDVTRRVTGFDCFQYRPRQLANRNVFVRSARAMVTMKVANKAKLRGMFIGSHVTSGPVPLTSLLDGHSLPTITIRVPDNRSFRTEGQAIEHGIRRTIEGRDVAATRNLIRAIYRFRDAVLVE
jgi:hypothetical protein